MSKHSKLGHYHSYAADIASQNSITISHFIVRCLQPFKLLIAIQLINSLIWALYLSLRPYILKIILDKLPHLNAHNIVDELWMAILMYILSGVFIVIIFRINDYVWLKFNSPLQRHVGDILMQRLMRHSLSLFQTNFAGNLTNKTKDVMSSIPDLSKLITYQFFSQFLSVAASIFTVWTVDYSFALLLTAWVILFVSGALLFSRKAKPLSATTSEVRSSVIGTMVDMLSNVASIHLFASQQSESKRLRKSFDKWVTAHQARDWLFLYMFAFQGFSFALYQALCFVLLIMGFKKGTVTAGDFALILTLNTNIINTLWTLSSDIGLLSDHLGNVTQGLSTILSPLTITDAPHAASLHVTEGRICYDNVTFHYPQSETLFKKMSVVIEPGQKVGLVGYSGSGKSTFVNLIMRLHDVTSGHILIDNQDIRTVTQYSLHKAIGTIPQDPSLFNRALRENICYGRPDATDAEIIEAAKQAHAHEFISELSHGYDMAVGERGSKLSGGQRQRIAIARAILKNAPILILDEATSQLDTVTERKIQESLWQLMQGKTTIIIAHRLSTLLHMDRILVFDQGAIVEDATHYELLARNGLYKTLWDAQVNGLLPNSKQHGNTDSTHDYHGNKHIV